MDYAQYESNETYEAATGVAYQRKINDLRPIEVYRRIVTIHDKIHILRERVIGTTGVKALEELETVFRNFYTGQKA